MSTRWLVFVSAVASTMPESPAPTMSTRSIALLGCLALRRSLPPKSTADADGAAHPTPQSTGCPPAGTRGLPVRGTRVVRGLRGWFGEGTRVGAGGKPLVSASRTGSHGGARSRGFRARRALALPSRAARTQRARPGLLHARRGTAQDRLRAHAAPAPPTPSGDREARTRARVAPLVCVEPCARRRAHADHPGCTRALVAR